jgi:hypothetical protein
VITILAFRHLLVRKLRAVFLLLGFALGVGVMIVLLSVGEAMLDQSRDVSLVGGGEVTVLPQGIDVEAMRTGGMGGMFFGIDRARFLTRQLLGGPRQRNVVRAVSPVIEGKLLYLRHGSRTVAVRAGGEIPSRARAVGAGLDLRSGRWADSRADSSYVTPSADRLYDELDRFHLPPTADSSWGEWHYFNLVTAPDEWWYITYLVGGEVPTGKWGGQLLITRRGAGGLHERFSWQSPSSQVRFDTTGADLSIGQNTVRQRDGIYRLKARVPGKGGEVRIDVSLAPAPNRYFPPVELRDGDFLSGYVVPALDAKASGTICVTGGCDSFTGVPAYHDHNWGVWRNVTWEWGAGRGSRLSLLYGGVYDPGRDSVTGHRMNSPFFLALVDSLGVKQVLRFTSIRYQGARPIRGSPRAVAPTNFTLVGARDADTVHLDVRVMDVMATEMRAGKFRRAFLQMRGRFTLAGRVAAETVADSGTGFFETYVPLP